jgi:hypothetical protein
MSDGVVPLGFATNWGLSHQVEGIPVKRFLCFLMTIICAGIIAGCGEGGGATDKASEQAKIDAMKKKMEDDKKMMEEQMGKNAGAPGKSADGDAAADMPKEGDADSTEKPDGDEPKAKE